MGGAGGTFASPEQGMWCEVQASFGRPIQVLLEGGMRETDMKGDTDRYKPVIQIRVTSNAQTVVIVKLGDFPVKTSHSCSYFRDRKEK